MKQLECIFPARPTLAEAIEMLEAVGYPRNIAEHLRRMEIKAERGCATNCAAHRYYDVVTDLEEEFEVCPAETGGVGDVIAGCPDGGIRYYCLPPNTNRFALQFDEGDYPELAHGDAALV